MAHPDCPVWLKTVSSEMPSSEVELNDALPLCLQMPEKGRCRRLTDIPAIRNASNDNAAAVDDTR